MLLHIDLEHEGSRNKRNKETKPRQKPRQLTSSGRTPHRLQVMVMRSRSKLWVKQSPRGLSVRPGRHLEPDRGSFLAQPITFYPKSYTGRYSCMVDGFEG